MRVRELLEAQSGYEKLVAKLKADHLQSFKALFQTKVPLWRGEQRMAIRDKSSPIAWLADAGRTFERRSLTDNNFVLHWISNSEKWEGVPSRKWSSSCALKAAHASTFGTPMLVIPADSVTTYASTPADFNYVITDSGHQVMDVGGSVGELIHQLRDFKHNMQSKWQKVPADLRRILSYKVIEHEFSDVFTDKHYHDISRVVDELRDFDERHNLKDISSTLHSMLHEVIDIIGDNSLDYWVDNNLTPEKLEVTVHDSITDLVDADLPLDAEVWFTGPYVLLLIDELWELKDPYKDKALIKLYQDVTS